MARESKHEHYNIQGELIENLAERLFLLEEMLARASNGKAKDYVNALSWTNALKNKIKSLNLGYSKERMLKIELYIELARKLERFNEFQSGSNYLWEALILITNIFKDNDMIFPKKTKGMSFKKFVDSEVK